VLIHISIGLLLVIIRVTKTLSTIYFRIDFLFFIDHVGEEEEPESGRAGPGSRVPSVVEHVSGP
jgi:hypothetical protein